MYIIGRASHKESLRKRSLRRLNNLEQYAETIQNQSTSIKDVSYCKDSYTKPLF
jgi:hypothetical protein